MGLRRRRGSGDLIGSLSLDLGWVHDSLVFFISMLTKCYAGMTSVVHRLLFVLYLVTRVEDHGERRDEMVTERENSL
jgi:hypothetical protein